MLFRCFVVVGSGADFVVAVLIVLGFIRIEEQMIAVPLRPWANGMDLSMKTPASCSGARKVGFSRWTFNQKEMANFFFCCSYYARLHLD